MKNVQIALIPKWHIVLWVSNFDLNTTDPLPVGGITQRLVIDPRPALDGNGYDPEILQGIVREHLPDLGYFEAEGYDVAFNLRLWTSSEI